MPRYELFFQDAPHLQRVLAEYRAQGMRHLNVPNKGPSLKGAPYRERVAEVVAFLAAAPGGNAGSVVPHYSLSHEYERDFERSVARLLGFWRECAGQHAPHVAEVLLVSGAARKLDTVHVLQKLATMEAAAPLAARVPFGVAWDPYTADRAGERRRLQQKLRTELVASVWLQFGTDPARLAEELAWFAAWREEEGRGAAHADGVRVYGSVFLPTAQHVQRFRQRPWTGIQCSEEYVNSVAGARAVTERLLTVYRAHDVVPLVESPVGTDVLAAQCHALLRDFPCTEAAVAAGPRAPPAADAPRTVKQRRASARSAVDSALLDPPAPQPPRRTAKVRRSGSGSGGQRPITAWAAPARRPEHVEEAPPAEEWQCSVCTVMNPAAADPCGVCGAGTPPGSRDHPIVLDSGDDDAAGAPGAWECTVCTLVNDASAARCAVCDALPNGALCAAALDAQSFQNSSWGTSRSQERTSPGTSDEEPPPKPAKKAAPAAKAGRKEAKRATEDLDAWDAASSTEETVTVFPAGAHGKPQTRGAAAKQQQPGTRRVCVVLFRAHELRSRDFEPLALALKNADRFDVIVPMFLWGGPGVEAEVVGSPVRPQCAEVYIAAALQRLAAKFAKDFKSQLVCRRVVYQPYMAGGGARLDALREACVAEVFSVVRDVLYDALRPGAAPLPRFDAVSITLYGGLRFEPVARRWDEAWQAALLRHHAYAHLVPHRAETLPMRVDDVQLLNTSLLYDVAGVPVDLQLPGANHYWGTLIPFLRCCKATFGKPRRPCGPVTHPRKLLPAAPKGKAKTTGTHSTLPLPEGLWGPTERGHGGGAPGERHTWRQKMLRAWSGATAAPFALDEDAAHAAMTRWVQGEGLHHYDAHRSRVDIETAVSRLSPCLKWGTLAPTALYWAVEDERRGVPDKDFAAVFSRRLFWRDLAYFQLHCFPEMHTASVRGHYEDTIWEDPDTDPDAKEKLRRLCFGKTGYALVDAGMRELQETGWMQQNVRMVVASFLTEYLGMHWVHGFRLFHDTLVDADLAINAMMWQNAGRSGVDQWNFVLNPTNGGTRDPQGTYTRRWCPELTATPMHSLFRAQPHALVQDLEGARVLTLERVRYMRARALRHIDGGGIDLLRLPNGGVFRVFTRRELRELERVGHVAIKDKVVDVVRLVDGRPHAAPGAGAGARLDTLAGGKKKEKAKEPLFKKKKKSRVQ